MKMNCPACNKILPIQEELYYECESNTPYHFYYQNVTNDYIRFDHGDYYFLIFSNNTVLEVWGEISGKGDKRLYSMPCDFNNFSKLCKLDDKSFNSKLRLLQVFS